MELNLDWEFVADTVMGGVSQGQIEHSIYQGRPATRLTGQVSLENDGGFVRMASDLTPDDDSFDASGFREISIDVFGNGESYDLRLRTTDLNRPWQSFRTNFTAPSQWTTHRFAFTDFEAHKTDVAFNPSRLRRVGILAIGHAFAADVAVSDVRLYS